VNKLLFNFAVSYSGGGYKRLYEYAKWFSANGGAWFVIHPNCRSLVDEFPNNRFFVTKQSSMSRLRNDCAYLKEIGEAIGVPDLYFSYGIPVYARFGRVNWFHLSNVLPLATQGIPLSLFDRAKLNLLGRRIRREFVNADVISAESDYSLRLIPSDFASRLFLSVNGSDDELSYLSEDRIPRRELIATVLGTRTHKAIEDSFLVFQALKTVNCNLKLAVIGEKEYLSKSLLAESDVFARGVLGRADVIESLRRSKFYISTTRIENSYNAASEGIFIAEESYISDIGPHRELLVNAIFEEVKFPALEKPMLHVRRRDLTGGNLKTWDAVVVETLARCRQVLRAG
jgi:hypothetical protein